MGLMGRLQINAVLFTRDGRHFGNAIVTGHDPDSRFSWQFTTDYGNVVKEMSTSDIHKYFRVGSVADTDHKHYVRGKNWWDRTDEHAVKRA